MQTVSETFEEICEQERYRTDFKVDIAGTEYLMSDLISARRYTSYLDSTDKLVGNVMSGTLEIKTIPQGTIPRGAEINPYIRVSTLDGTSVSEWIQHGTYYVSQRTTGEFGNTTATVFTCYDAICKTDKSYADSTEFEVWPQSDEDVAEEIASIIGVTLDPRTTLSGYDVPHPGDLTMREVLSYIGASNAGNWVITNENQLLMIPLVMDTDTLLGDHDDNIIEFFGNVFLSVGEVPGGSAHDSYDIGRNVERYEDLGLTQSISGVEIYYDDETAFVAGTDTGNMLQIDCPWATQQMADALLAIVDDYQNQGFNATLAFIPPYVEIGDIAIVGDLENPISTIDVSYGTMYRPNLSSPGSDDIESEYPYLSQSERELKRAVKVGRDYYGTRIDHANGITITRTNGIDEYNALTINSDAMMARDENGNNILEMDFRNQTFLWNGDINIRDGSITFDQLGETATNFITGTVNALSSQVSETYYTKDDAATLETTLTNKITQTSDNIDIAFSEINNTIDDLKSEDEANKNAIQSVTSHILIGPATMTFRVDGAEYELQITNTGVTISVPGGDVVAEFSADGVLLPSQTEVPLGGTFTLGNFRWTPRSSGNLSMVYVGS